MKLHVYSFNFNYIIFLKYIKVTVMAFNATFIPVILWWSALLQSLPRVVGPYTLSNLCQRLYAKNQIKNQSQVTLVVIGTDCIGSYKCNYHTITTTTAP
jgi:hypothetical protein